MIPFPIASTGRGAARPARRRWQASAEGVAIKRIVVASLATSAVLTIVTCRKVTLSLMAAGAGGLVAGTAAPGGDLLERVMFRVVDPMLGASLVARIRDGGR